MKPLWTWTSPHPVEVTVERAQAAVKRAWPGSAGNAFWGMRGGYVQPLPERTLAFRVASQQLELTCSLEDLEDPEIRSKLGRIAQTIATEFDLPPSEAAELDAATRPIRSNGAAGPGVHVLDVDLPDAPPKEQEAPANTPATSPHSERPSDALRALAGVVRAQSERIAALEATLRALGSERLVTDVAPAVSDAIQRALRTTQRGASAAAVTLELEVGASLDDDGLEALIGPRDAEGSQPGRIRVTVRLEELDG